MRPSDNDISVRRQKYVVGLLIRVIICLIFVAVFAITASLLSPPARSHFLPAIGILGFLLAANYPFWLIGKAYDFPLEHFYGHWFLDLFMVTLIVHVLGGIELPCGFVAYMIMILTSAVFLSQEASFIIATGSTIFFDGLVILEGIGLVPHQAQIWDHEYTRAAQVIILLASNVFFYLFAFLAGSLAEQLKEATAALAAAEGELRKYNRTLEANVRERTLALEEKNREIEEFVHIVTHDLRNVSIGAAELARRLLTTDRSNLSAKGQRYASNLLEDTRQMNGMLNHLLALFRVDNERELIEPVETGELVRSVLAANSRRLEEKGISVVVAPLPKVLIDPIQMKHVLTNLVDNAIKYTGDKPEPRIVIECEERPDCYRFVVRDNGIGISPGQQRRVFHLYHRGPDQRVAGVEQQGQGVGLAITKRIVERWGGEIWVESESRRGASFHFTCPKGRKPREVAV